MEVYGNQDELQKVLGIDEVELGRKILYNKYLDKCEEEGDEENSNYSYYMMQKIDKD